MATLALSAGTKYGPKIIAGLILFIGISVLAGGIGILVSGIQNSGSSKCKGCNDE